MHTHYAAHDVNHWLFSEQGSRFYNHVFARLGKPLYRRVVEDVAALAPIDALLDVGTGTGQLVCALVEGQFARSTSGVDPAPAMIARARENAQGRGLADRAHFEVGDARQLPYGNESFDLIVSTISMHHWPEIESPLHELYRVLRPGGRVWIYDFSMVKNETVLEAARKTRFGNQADRTNLDIRFLGWKPFVRWTLTRQ